MLDFNEFDGKFSPRGKQKEIIDKIQECYKSYDIIVIQAPTGTGKGPLSRAIQKAIRKNNERAVIIHPNNLLIEQLKGDYPEINKLVGSVHYECVDEMFSSCGAKKAAEGKACRRCPGCPYVNAIEGYKTKEDTVTNVQSHILLGKYMPAAPQYDVTIIDEADASISFLDAFTGITISEDILPFKDEDAESITSAINYLTKVESRLKDLMQVEVDANKKEKLESKLEHLAYIMKLMAKYEDKYAVSIEESPYLKKRSLAVKPVTIPPSALKDLLGKKAILLSATIYPSQIKQILGEDIKIKLIKVSSPFDSWRQQLVYKRYPGGIKYNTEVSKICEKIAEDINEFGVNGVNTNTLVHASYSQKEEYRDALRALGIPAVTHTKGDKRDILDEWKEKGGVLIGAGMAEGLDLKDDLVRLQFLPRIIKGTGELLEKRRRLLNGKMLDELRIWSQIIQTNGRGCRNENDFCITICYDSFLLSLYNSTKRYSEAPDWFYECISVGGKLLKGTPSNFKEMFK